MRNPAHLLDPSVTPTNAMFVRNNGLPPRLTANSETVSIDGESCLSPRTFTVDALRREFETVTLQLQLECGGNGRAEFRPRVPGNQWTTGAIGCPRWTGVRLRDVLNACGVREDAVYVAYEGADLHLSGNPDKRPISRGAPIAKAREAESLIAWEMNGAPLPIEHGAPLRLVMGGWPGSPREVAPPNHGPQPHSRRAENGWLRLSDPLYARGARDRRRERRHASSSMPVKSLITSPRSGVASSRVGLESGATPGRRPRRRARRSEHRLRCNLADNHPEAPANRLAGSASVAGPDADRGLSRSLGESDRCVRHKWPMHVPGWNPKGYLNNAAHRIALQADA